MIYQLQFWVLVVGLVAYVARYFFPEFPLDEQQILAGVLALLGAIGITPQVRGAVPADSILKSLSFWTLVAGLIGFVARFYAPEFPYTDAVILSIIVFLLREVGINPELRARGVLK